MLGLLLHYGRIVPVVPADGFDYRPVVVVDDTGFRNEHPPGQFHCEVPVEGDGNQVCAHAACLDPV